MSHLKVELRSLKRSSLPNGYAFDLTKQCNGCWIKFGRFTNRGRKCPECRRKVCKSCRIGLCDSKKWMCLGCCKNRYTSSSSSKTLSSKKMHSIDENDRHYSLYSARIIAYLPRGSKPVTNTRCWRLARPQIIKEEHENITILRHSSTNSLSRNHSLFSEGNVSEKLPENEENGHEPPPPIKMPPNPENTEPTVQHQRTRPLRKYEYWRFHRNDPHGRFSTRDGYVTKNRGYHLNIKRNVLLADTGDFAPFGSRSVSLPEILLDPDPDPDRFHRDFVEFRVRKLEEDLARDMMRDRWYYYEDIDLHSLCALNLEIKVPDKNDYRLVYLSSSHSSENSFVDNSLENSWTSLDCKSLLKQLNSRDISVDSGEWNFSQISTESESSSSYVGQLPVINGAEESNFNTESGYFEDMYEDHYPSTTSDLLLSKVGSLITNAGPLKNTKLVCSIPPGMTFHRGCLLDKFVEALRALTHIFYYSDGNRFLERYGDCRSLLSFEPRVFEGDGGGHWKRTAALGKVPENSSSIIASGQSRFVQRNEFTKLYECPKTIEQPDKDSAASKARREKAFGIQRRRKSHELHFQQNTIAGNNNNDPHDKTLNKAMILNATIQEKQKHVTIVTTTRKESTARGGSGIFFNSSQQLEQDGTLHSSGPVIDNFFCRRLGSFRKHSLSKSFKAALNANSTNRKHDQCSFSIEEEEDPGDELRLTEERSNYDYDSSFCDNNGNPFSPAEHQSLERKCIRFSNLSLIDMEIKIFPSYSGNTLGHNTIVFNVPSRNGFLPQTTSSMVVVVLFKAPYPFVFASGGNPIGSPSLRGDWDSSSSSEHFTHNRGNRPCFESLIGNYNILVESRVNGESQSDKYAFFIGKMKVTNTSCGCSAIEGCCRNGGSFRVNQGVKRNYFKFLMIGEGSAGRRVMSKKRLKRLKKRLFYSSCLRIDSNSGGVVLVTNARIPEEVDDVGDFSSPPNRRSTSPAVDSHLKLSGRMSSTTPSGKRRARFTFNRASSSSSYYVVILAFERSRGEEKKTPHHNSDGIPNRIIIIAMSRRKRRERGETSDTIINALRKRGNLSQVQLLLQLLLLPPKKKSASGAFGLSSTKRHASSANFAPETEVIDTQSACVITSKTGCGLLFVERCGLPRLFASCSGVEAAAAVQRSVEHGLLRGADQRSSIASTIAGLLVTSGSVNRTNDWTFLNLFDDDDDDYYGYRDFLLHFSRSALVTSSSGQGRLGLLFTTIAGQADCVSVGNGGLDLFIRGCEMSLDNGARSNNRGKIAKLKKFFDSGAGSGGDSDGVNNVDGMDAKESDSNSGESVSMASSSLMCGDDNVTSGVKVNGADNTSGAVDIPVAKCKPKAQLNMDHVENGLWHMRDVTLVDSHAVDAFSDFKSPAGALAVSTEELNNLIASSKAELSRSSESYDRPEKSNLEFYFESAFENSQPPRRKFLSSELISYHDSDGNDSRNGVDSCPELLTLNDYIGNGGNMYRCDNEEMYFDDLDDDDAVLSDGSSDEEMKCRRSPVNNGHAQPYALHTIIEESCEESERESRTATPTNRGPASKLEKYFSWDIVNNSKNLKKGKDRDGMDDDDDESTLYSDSLSEASGSLAGDNIEPSPLQSSCLEKYFTSGLVGNDSSRYPDEGDQYDNTSISDFDEDDKYHKISRSALLSSIEVAPSPSLKRTGVGRAQGKETSDNSFESDASGESKEDFASSNHLDLAFEDKTIESNVLNSVDAHQSNMASTAAEVDQSVPLDSNVSEVSPVALGAEKNNIESEINYIAAWQILENELQQLMKIMPSTTQAENNGNNSNNGSTYGSSHSDYGSDTVDAGECLTADEDENCIESKNRNNASQAAPNDKATKILQSSNKEENVDVIKRFLQYLNKEGVTDLLDAMSSNNSSQNAKEHVVALFKSIMNGQGLAAFMEYDSSDSVQAVMLCLEKINMNYNGKLSDASNHNDECNSRPTLLNETFTVPVDEGISVESTENLAADCDNLHLCDPDVEPSNDFTNETSNHRQSSSNIFLVPSTNGIMENTESADSVESSPSRDICDRNPTNSNLEDSSSQFSLYVDIEINDKSTSVKERQRSNIANDTSPQTSHRSSVHLWVSDGDDIVPETCNSVKDSVTTKNDSEVIFKVPNKVTRAISEPTLVDDSTKLSQHINEPHVSDHHSFDSDHIDQPETEDFGSRSFELELRPANGFSGSQSSSRCSSIRSTLSATALSQSITNLSGGIDPGLKFSSLQPKPRMSKVSMNPHHHAVPESRHISSFLSPSTVFKKFKLPKTTGSPSSEISYPAKYLKKYGRSSSFESESMCGAASMPHLNLVRGDSYSASGAIFDCDRESSLTVDDDGKNSYFGCNHSALSLGAHSASTASVYSSAGGRYYCNVSVSGDVLFGLNYNQKSQSMEVFVKQCRNLTAVDVKKNRSDPYVKVYLMPDKSKSGKRKTKTKKNTLNPVFNELLRFPVQKQELESRTLWLSVWNSDLFGRNDFLGEVMLSLGQRLLDSPTLRWYPLQERAESLSAPLTYKGELFLALRYVPKDLSLEPRFRPAPVISLKGALHVLVKEARNIAVGKNSGGAFDTFCKSYLLPDKSKSSKQKTPIVKRSQHPKWYYTMIYEDLSIEELKERSLELTLWDHDRITSNEFIGGIRLNIGTGLYHGVPVEWMDSSRDETSLWQAMLERPNMWVDGSLPLRPTLHSLRT